MADILRQWAEGMDLAMPDDPKAATTGRPSFQAIVLFQQGLKLYREQRVDEAMELWRQGLALEPSNYIIRKQIWAVENPDRFYSGDVDYDWQREQMAKEQ